MVCSIRITLTLRHVPPPGLSRWTQAFALLEFLSSGAIRVVQKPVNHRGKPGGGQKPSMETDQMSDPRFDPHSPPEESILVPPPLESRGDGLTRRREDAEDTFVEEFVRIPCDQEV